MLLTHQGAANFSTTEAGKFRRLAAVNWLFHCWSRKNIWVPVMGLITTFCPLMTTGAGELVVQTADEPRFVVDCKL